MLSIVERNDSLLVSQLKPPVNFKGNGFSVQVDRLCDLLSKVSIRSDCRQCDLFTFSKGKKVPLRVLQRFSVSSSQNHRTRERPEPAADLEALLLETGNLGLVAENAKARCKKALEYSNTTAGSETTFCCGQIVKTLITLSDTVMFRVLLASEDFRLDI